MLAKQGPGSDTITIFAVAMRDAAQEGAAGSAEAGFHDEWRRRAAAAVDTAVQEAHARDEQPEVDAYGRLDGLHAAMGALMVEADRADVEDAAGRPE